MITCPIKTVTGGDAGEYTFEEADLVQRTGDQPLISKQLLHDACVMYEANKRVGTVRTRGRGDVVGSTKKLFRQKGTGRARAGNKRTPIRRGGGHTFAKRPKDWSYRIPKKALRLATRMALLSKFQDSQAIVLDELQVDRPKTKTIADMLNAIGVHRNTALLVVPDYDSTVHRSARNIESLWMRPVSQMNAYDLLHQRHLVITKAAMDAIISGNSAAAQTGGVAHAVEASADRVAMATEAAS